MKTQIYCIYRRRVEAQQMRTTETIYGPTWDPYRMKRSPRLRPSSASKKHGSLEKERGNSSSNDLVIVVAVDVDDDLLLLYYNSNRRLKKALALTGLRMVFSQLQPTNVQKTHLANRFTWLGATLAFWRQFWLQCFCTTEGHLLYVHNAKWKGEGYTQLIK